MISECLFADDLVVLANTEKDLQINLNIWNEELKKFNMSINIEKTKTMIITKENKKVVIKVEDNIIDQVENYKYLGTIIQNTGSYEEEINARLQATSKVYHAINKTIINNKQLDKNTKMTVFKTVYQPILIHGSETWILNKSQKSKIQAMEMKYLRRVKGITKKYKIRSETIGKELEVKSTIKKIQQKQMNWYGHLIRMKDDRQVKKVWRTKSGKRGRPQKKWVQIIQEILVEREITRRDANEKAKDGKQWKKFTEE